MNIGRDWEVSFVFRRKFKVKKLFNTGMMFLFFFGYRDVFEGG